MGMPLERPSARDQLPNPDNEMSRKLVSEANFIRATRDAGYKNIASALAELVDNALQAGAARVEIFVQESRDANGKRGISVGVLDDGVGMDAETLHTALQFGGTQRFNDRNGSGRFGMGLPNSSLSQATRVDVYAWQQRQMCVHSYLDVDEFASGKRSTIPRPGQAPLPFWALSSANESGVLVLWSGCDRLKHRKASTIADWVRRALGRMYYYPLSEGLKLIVNRQSVEPMDPLFRRVPGIDSAARPFGKPLLYEMTTPGGSGSSVIEVLFTEFPVREWALLPNETKRGLGIVGGAGVSIIRLGREIDCGWLLMGGKRRENYDDWWRCEVRFHPVLDELFGVTHTKQGIRPTPELKAILEPELEAVARRLNSRVRAAFLEVQATRPSRAVASAHQQDRFLPPVETRTSQPLSALKGKQYRIEIARFETREPFRTRAEEGTIVLSLNEQHPFYRRVYKEALAHQEELFRLESLLLAAARACLAIRAAGHEAVDYEFRSLWGDALAAFLR